MQSQPSHIPARTGEAWAGSGVGKTPCKLEELLLPEPGGCAQLFWAGSRLLSACGGTFTTADFTRCKSWLCAWVISSYWLIKSTLYPQALLVNVPPCLWLHKVIPYCLAQLYVGELHLNSPIKEPLLYSNIKRNHLWVLNLYLNIILTMCWVEKGSSLKHKKGILSMWGFKSTSIF